MEQTVFYMAHIDELRKGEETVFRTEYKGLFTTYRAASQWLLDEGLEVWAIHCFLTNEPDLYFGLNSSTDDESYVGYIEALTIIE